jgi:hypothetical protein
VTRPLVHNEPLLQPRIAGLMPAVLYRDLPHEAADAAAVLGLALSQFGHVRGRALQADLDVPEGSWRYWPHVGLAAWLGRRGTSGVPPVRAKLTRARLDLVDAIQRLLTRGRWTSEMRLLGSDGEWSPSQPLKGAIEALLAGREDIVAVSGLWSDGHGRPVRVELFCDGQAWASNPVDAERWLLIASGLADD